MRHLQLQTDLLTYAILAGSLHHNSTASRAAWLPGVLPVAAGDRCHQRHLSWQPPRAQHSQQLEQTGWLPDALQVAALTEALQRSQAEVAELQHLQQSAAQQFAESAAEVRRLGGAVQLATASSAAELRAQEQQGAALREETRKRQVGSSDSWAL